ncbi:MAG: L-serine ammonia-lyase, iron-sulfur-dependent subunit beta [Thermus sp.]|uniref:L-serine ammonia-lyase, iron-sulfur-dependent subunit beta n=1 Tax=unclassified Thermus TaxID=2619321 RepID=UPI0002389224|nr:MULTISPECIES: L-serine ammonia-lyase, iron-sulfur-dependent subunit beta [unclassified Thermus]AEV16510.1 L-serine dehydratase, iron-sulfur-dependent, beta subunit [Thermus sp. CCB_US3_UF1]MCS6869493.1 L-serine ammonia-lyase, iron-sulfur-dependent subunit beta [Thermus sp.]MCS7217612.1 L-serine ammonia-lyase, iron-sulfur-dependent subunit beta [Thermus sp.]MCX7849397.1 L-serine ammonia-lyase, iron-sulfur-dependent subunit beta [Thermus sp.]MDW8017636.1 L-serine ammonia-lyase, iron-sulfur-de
MGLLDMIGPVMVGPSSSHTAGACRLALLARHLLGEKPKRVEFGLHGSFAKTGQGHGTHLALAAGILGLRPDDERLKESLALAEREGVEVVFREVELGDVHPNTVRMALEGEKERLLVTGSSLGGGLVRVFDVEGFEVRITGAAPTLVVRNVDTPGVVARVARILADDEVNIAHLTVSRKKRGGEAMMSIEMDRALTAKPLEYLEYLSYILWVRQIPPVMD